MKIDMNYVSVGRAAPMSASALLFEWYTKTPRLWKACDNRQYKSTSKQIVRYMKLFLPHDFQLDPSAKGYTDKALQVGNEAQENLMNFLCSRGIQRKFGSGLGLLKKPPELQRHDVLSELIKPCNTRVAGG